MVLAIDGVSNSRRGRRDSESELRLLEAKID